MKYYRYRNYYKILIIIGGSVVLLFLAVFFLLTYLENKIDAKLTSIHSKASSIDIGLWDQSIVFNGITLGISEDSINSADQFLKLQRASLRGINVYDLMINNILLADELTVDNGTLYYTRDTKHKDSTDRAVLNAAFSFRNFVANNIETQIRTDTIVNLTAVVDCHLTDVNFKIDSIGKFDYDVRGARIIARRISFNRHEGTHGGTIAQLTYNSLNRVATLDSTRVVPNYGKFEIGKHFGQQKNHITAVFPKITIEGLPLDKMLDSTFVASRIEILSFNITAFKDKRLPFLKKEIVSMPMETFLKLPFRVTVDSILIKDSHITVEEFPEGSAQRIHVTFNHVSGKFARLNNRIVKGDSTVATLQAHGLLMNKGIVDAVFKFPLDGSPIYTAKGSISKMPFTELNEALANTAALQVQSGFLNSLKFDFKYTDQSSIGKLVINYKDLKLSGLKKDKGIDRIKTLLINMFIKNDKTRQLPESERTGIINVERNRKKFIFNLWWLSIRDGLESSILGTAKPNLAKP